MKCLILISFSVFVFESCYEMEKYSETCKNVTKIEGIYDCSGQCVVTDSKGNKKLINVYDEIDTVQLFKGATEGVYQVNIGGRDSFHEIEIGVLTGLTLHTATAQVSDTLYPVLEEYVFETDPSCEAVSFTKIVRNPTKEFFKACRIICIKKD